MTRIRPAGASVRRADTGQSGRSPLRVGSGDGDSGAGSVLAVGILGAVVLLTMLVLPVLAVLVVGQTVRAAADAAALAAADTLSGLVAGVPCEAAAEIAALDGASVVSCTTAGPIASVTVTRQVLGWTLNAHARAGPPGSAEVRESPGIAQGEAPNQSNRASR